MQQPEVNKTEEEGKEGGEMILFCSSVPCFLRHGSLAPELVAQSITDLQARGICATFP